ncbi:hypothetical protein DES53_108109 [Roseimicrobium gellanilyticum]|uniref:Uncharacterized protein n=1 Tax=Roseimicrobium gellanilyticum TaxID=748857 RepID=A0A366HD68_9BACT|nr:hypothetical protein [Roseimicrobium gellanilyticum]RBP40402.1 hypothetical protein DES53_108109 [Roseimicrobium gellanilyticum]
MPKFFHIRSAKFPVLPGEEEEIVNPDTYGKAFATFIRDGLLQRGWNSPFLCCEDWGWWIEMQLPDTSFGICCYRQGEDNGECDLICSPSPDSDKKWSWKKFRRVNIGPDLRRLEADLESLFREDPEIQWMGKLDEMPW